MVAWLSFAPELVSLKDEENTVKSGMNNMISTVVEITISTRVNPLSLRGVFISSRSFRSAGGVVHVRLIRSILSAMICRQNGYMLVVILVLAVIVGALGFSLFKVSQQHVHLSAFYADRERAYHLAVGGMKIGQEFLHKAFGYVNVKDKAVPPVFKDFVKWFREHNEGNYEAPEIEISPVALEALRDAQKNAVLKLYVRRGPREPVYAGSTSALKPDPGETRSKIILTSKAAYRKAQARVDGCSWVNWVSVLPPVLGKFVFYLKQPDSLDLNPVKDSNVNLITAPVNILAGLPFTNIATGTTNPLALSYEKKDGLTMRDEIDRRGWIYLGTSDEYDLGVAAAGNEEKFAAPLDLRKIEFPLDEDSFISKEGDATLMFYKNPPHREINSLGVVWQDSSASYGEDLNSQLFQLHPDEKLYTHSSVLNLFGPRSSPSPTFVIGNVYRRFLSIRGILADLRDPGGFGSDGFKELYLLPYLDSNTFAKSETVEWPGKPDGLVKQLIVSYCSQVVDAGEDPYEGCYKYCMSDVTKRPYNEAILEFLKLPASMKDELFPEFTPGAPGSPPGLARIAMDGKPASFLKLSPGDKVTIKNDQGDVIFENGVLGGLEDLEYLRAKGRSYRGQTSLLNSIRESKPSGTMGMKVFLGGVVYVAGDFQLQEPLEVLSGGGGLILVENKILIEAGIKCAPGEPLTLASLGGDVTLATSDMVQAGLVALRGRVSLPYEMNLNGFLAAQKLSIKAGSGAVNRELKWNSIFDPTDFKQYLRSFKASVVSKWHYNVSYLKELN